MKRGILFILCFFSLSSVTAQVEKDSLGYETFEYEDGDTTFLMKKYFLVLLKRGSNQEDNEAKLSRIQAGHMAHMDSLAQLGQLDIAGPIAVDSEIRGILILRVPDFERAEACVQADPAVKAKRLSYQILPWWAAVGSTLR